MDNFFNTVLEKIRILRNIDFSDYISERTERTIMERMAALHITDPLQYVDLLTDDPKECDNLIDNILITVSSFFRNPIVFEIISQTILPQIIDQKKEEGLKEIRVWCAGCATGEEPYSIAILIHEALKNLFPDWTPFIFATDINQDALKKADTGMYSREQLKNTKLGIIGDYFSSGNAAYEILPEIKDMVLFSVDDLVSRNRFAPAESVFGTFDLILCRNVLIYFSLKLQNRVLGKLYKALANSGFLILGSCESLGLEMKNRLITVDTRNRIYQKS